MLEQGRGEGSLRADKRFRRNEENELSADERLIDATLGGDRDALGKLFAKYRDRLFFTINTIVKNPQKSEELVHDVFIKIMLNIDRFQRGSSFYTWAYRIAKNRATDEIRRTRNRPEVHYEEWDDESKERKGPRFDPAASTDTEYGKPADTSIEQQEQRELLARAINTLRPKLRETAILRLVAELPEKETAEILDIPVNTVGTRMFQANPQLRITMRRLGQKDTSGRTEKTNIRAQLEAEARELIRLHELQKKFDDTPEHMSNGRATAK